MFVILRRRSSTDYFKSFSSIKQIEVKLTIVSVVIVLQVALLYLFGCILFKVLVVIVVIFFDEQIREPLLVVTGRP